MDWREKVSDILRSLETDLIDYFPGQEEETWIEHVSDIMNDVQDRLEKVQVERGPDDD